MKILVINGRPRAKGNSDLLCDEFIRGAEEAGNQVEKNIPQGERDFSLPGMLRMFPDRFLCSAG